jgi:hypothetical protein
MHTQRATELRRDQRCRSLVYGLMATFLLAEDGSQAYLKSPCAARIVLQLECEFAKPIA